MAVDPGRWSARLIGPVLGGILADATGSYRVPFYITSAVTFAGLGLVWFIVREDFVPPAEGAKSRSLLAGLSLLLGSASLMALFFVLFMAQFSVRTVQPMVTLFVAGTDWLAAGNRDIGGIAFSITGLANLVAAPFLGNRSDIIGYRRVLLICLLGATLTSVPQIFVNSYWLFVVENVRGRIVHRRHICRPPTR